MLLRMIDLATGLDAFLSSFSTSRRCFRNRSPSRLPVSPIYNFFAKSASYTVDDMAEVQLNCSVILMNRQLPNLFTVANSPFYCCHKEVTVYKLTVFSFLVF